MKPKIKHSKDGYWYVELCGSTQLDRLAMEWVVKANARR